MTDQKNDATEYMWKGEPCPNPEKGWITDSRDNRLTRLGNRNAFGKIIQAHNREVEIMHQRLSRAQPVADDAGGGERPREIWVDHTAEAFTDDVRISQGLTRYIRADVIRQPAAADNRKLTLPSNEWLRKRIESDPDMECEAGLPLSAADNRGKDEKAFPIIEFHQWDWIEGFAAFIEDGQVFNEDSKAFCVLNLGSFLTAIRTENIPAHQVPYFIAESMMHEIIHVIEKWAEQEFSEGKVEELLARYYESVKRKTLPSEERISIPSANEAALAWFNERVDAFGIKHPQQAQFIDTIRQGLLRTTPEDAKGDVCPTCNGDGCTVEVQPACCGRGSESGECCGIPVPEQVQEQCGHCYGSGVIAPQPEHEGEK